MIYHEGLAKLNHVAQGFTLLNFEYLQVNYSTFLGPHANACQPSSWEKFPSNWIKTYVCCLLPLHCATLRNMWPFLA